MLIHDDEKFLAVESSHSFGDAVFNIPLIKAISEHYGHKVTVSTNEPYQDGYYNVPWINNIVVAAGLGYGSIMLRNLGYKHVIQITQNAKFPHYKTIDPDHSLIDTPLWVGRELGLPDFDQRPMFFPTDEEIENTEEIVTGQPTIAIESHFNSGQSWAKPEDIEKIVEKFKDTHRILWLSNRDAPELDCVDDLLRFTRREVIMCLRAADIFFSVGSGFFCASLALPKKWQPKKSVCLWRDVMFKYKNRLNELKWHDDLTWVDGDWQLPQVLKDISGCGSVW